VALVTRSTATSPSRGISGSALTDLQIEALATNLKTSDWANHAVTPLARWKLNQASTGTAVEDLIGSADQLALTGTDLVVGDDPPGWTFDGTGGAAPSTARPQVPDPLDLGGRVGTGDSRGLGQPSISARQRSIMARGFSQYVNLQPWLEA
jgi:hypothetical protein